MLPCHTLVHGCRAGGFGLGNSGRYVLGVYPVGGASMEDVSRGRKNAFDDSFTLYLSLSRYGNLDEFGALGTNEGAPG